MSRKIIILLCVIFITGNALSQIIPNVIVFERDSLIVDSLKNAEYPYIFPFWGESVQKKGIQLPKSAGLSLNYLWQESDIVINNLRIGFNNKPMVELGDVVRFNNSVSTSNGVNIRPDVWVLPFLNVYGIFARAKTSTSIEASVSVPDSSNNWREITTVSTKADFDATTFGFGITPTVGVGGGWVALDMNFTWSDIDALSKPAFAFVFGPRVGKTFKIGGTDMELAIWVGGFRMDIAGGTDGSLDLAGLLPIDELQTKVDQGLIRVDQAQEEIDAWWDGLSPTDQRKPGNVAKYETANRVIGRAGTALSNLEGALSNAETATIQYSLDKRQKNIWNFIIGTQFQLNRSWMFRAEYGFLGSRQQFIGGIQYRFGL
jgi:opacity protein-like surface antigen